MSARGSAARSDHLIRSFHVMAKPAGALCNLDCTYCYYLHKQDLLPKTPASPLSDELLEEFIRQCIVGQDVDIGRLHLARGRAHAAGAGFLSKSGRAAAEVRQGERNQERLADQRAAA